MRSKTALFIAAVLVVAALAAVSWWLIGLPACADPEAAWIPCVG